MAISAKRYTLFELDQSGNPVLLRCSCPFCGRKNKPRDSRCENKECSKAIQLNNEEDRWSEHGLGHLLNPTDPESNDRDWIAQAWLNIVRKHLGMSTKPLGFESQPAVGRISVSSPMMMKPLANLNDKKKYGDRIKPFNFLLACHVRPFGHPTDVDPARFHLISPYESDSRKWLKKLWIDQYSGKEYGITTSGIHGSRTTARVETYGNKLLDYEVHPESKHADLNGNVCSKQTVGLLYRRHVTIDLVKYIGKESNNLEEVESGLIHSDANVYTEYPDVRSDEWQTKIVPALKEITLSTLQRQTGLSRRMLIKARSGKVRPHSQNRKLLTAVVARLGVV